VATTEGRFRLDAIRRRLARVLAVADAEGASQVASARTEARQAFAIGVGALVLSALLVLLFAAHLARRIGRPVRRTAAAAGRLATGDLSIRLEETGPGEIAELTAAFNAMAESLERGKRELEEQNEELRESERLRAELVSIVSHEIRTPLASVLGYTSLLLRRDFDEAERRRYLEIVAAEGRRLGALIDEFLEIREAERHGLELREQLLDVAELLSEQVGVFADQSDVHTLELHLPDEPLVARGDPDRLAQVVSNLLTNAIKYSPEGGTIEVSAERDGESVCVQVRDEGLGIPAVDQARIFTKFFRSEARARGIAGVGLGLAISREIVEAHGGRIGFTSEPGAGSVFWFRLPRAPQKPAGGPGAGRPEAEVGDERARIRARDAGEA